MAERPQKNMIVAIAILAIVLAAIMVRQSGVLSGKPEKSGDSAASAPSGTVAAAATSGTESAAASPSPVQMHWKRPDAVGPVVRDPMRMDLAKQLPPDTSTKPDTPPRGTEFSVTGIIYSTEQPSSAIIDGRILREGDTVYGATITRINEDSVEFKIGDKRWAVRAGERTVSQE